LKEILGDCILEAHDCDDVISLPVSIMLMGRRMVAQAKLPTLPNSECPKNRKQIVMKSTREKVARRLMCQLQECDYNVLKFLWFNQFFLG